ncbi:serine/threonine kinase [Nocardiopsis lucentensis]|uniref:serine/threonine kinase n=1 Tax=Nocardiopsis lucentensis TaxID=53441 RepID=UPI00034BD9CF|nr:serine/threonine kinase [Nocardiopsis lucentensis]
MSLGAKFGIGCGGCASVAVSAFVFLSLIGLLAGPPDSEPVTAASSSSPSPSESPTPITPEVIGLDLPAAEEELDDASFSLGEVVLAASGDDVAWNRSAMLVCYQEVDDTVVDLGVAPDGVDCPEAPDAAQEWPTLPDFVDDTVSEAQEWTESAGVSGVEVSAAFGDVDAPAQEDAADHLVCEQSPEAAGETAPYRDGLVVEVFVVGSDEECPAEIGDPRPEPEPEPEPEPAPAPAPAPDPEPEPEPEAPSHVRGVHPGAFCDEYWQYGYTSAGTLMQCKTTATDDRFRWRAA